MKTSLRNIKPHLLVSADVDAESLTNAEIRSNFKKLHPEVREIFFLDNLPLSDRSTAMEVCSANPNLVLYRAVATRYITQENKVNILVLGMTTLC